MVVAKEAKATKKKGNKNKKSGANSRPKLRFKYGQRVECATGGDWEVGTGEH
jgi:hypothetical protein